MIIGITGTIGAGKGTVVNFLIRKGFKHYSVREFLVDEIQRRGLIVNRDSMVLTANDLRERYGPGYIVEQLYKKAKLSKGDSVVESIRTVGEIETLRKLGNFILFAIDCDIHKRYARIIGRKSETDNVSFEEFSFHEQREMKSEDKSHQNLRKCIEMADYVFTNNDLIEDLYSKVNEVVEKILRENIEYNDLKENKDETTLDKKNIEIRELKKEVHVRPSWDEYFFEIMDSVAKRATCDRGRSGCVVAKDKHILVTGYVGSPVGLPHCDEVGHQMKQTIHEDGHISNHCVRTAHAEQNAICQAAKLGVPLEGSTLYCFMSPCPICAKMIINSGIKRVACKKRYHDGYECEEMFKQAGVKLDILDDTLAKYENQ